MLTTVVGSYPKIGGSDEQQRLRRIISQHEKNEVDDDTLYDAFDEAIKGAVKEQLETGLDIITEGQIVSCYLESFTACQLNGVERGDLFRYFDTNTFLKRPIIKKDVKWNNPILDFDYFNAALNSNKPVKAVIPGPYTIARFSKNEFYKSFDDLVLRLAEELNNEVKYFTKLNPPIIQIDEPAILRNKQDIELFSKAFTRLVDGVKNTKVALYTYFGDIEGIIEPLQDLPLDIIGVDFIYGKKNYNLLKGFKKELGFGIVDGRNTRLEDKADLIVDIIKAAEFVDPEKIYINPSCGLVYLPRKEAKLKLTNMVEATKRAIGLIDRTKLEFDTYGRI